MRCCRHSASPRLDIGVQAATQQEINTVSMRRKQDSTPTEQCLAWNSDPAHQRLAGQARARQFTSGRRWLAARSRLRLGRARETSWLGIAKRHHAPRLGTYTAIGCNMKFLLQSLDSGFRE